MLNQSHAARVDETPFATQATKTFALGGISDQNAFPSDLSSGRIPVERVTTSAPRLYEILTSDDVANLRRAIVQRRQRYEYFENDLFFDPAWDIILTLAYAEVEQRRVSTTELCAASAVPATTALRWICNMTAQGALARRSDPFDRRRVYVELTEATSMSVSRYLHKIRH